jgi:hypothetical protein
VAVYDDQDERTNTRLPSDDDLRNITGINEEQEGAHEREATSGAASDILAREQAVAKGSAVGIGSLAGMEAAAQKQPAEGGGGSSGSSFGFRKEKLKGLANLRSKSKKLSKSKWLIGGAAGGGLMLVALIALLFLIGGQLIPNFAQNMIAYSFARVTRETVDSTTKVNAESIALDSAPDNVYQQAGNEFANDVDKTTNENLWDTINKYRPEKVVQTLKADGQISYVYGQDKSFSILGKITKRQTLQKIYIGGQEIDVVKNSFSTIDKVLNPVDYIKGLWQTNSLIKASLADVQGTTLRGTNWLIRSKAARIIQQDFDVKLYWKDRQQLNELEDETPEKADVTNQQQEYERITDNGAAAVEAETGTQGQEQQAADEAKTAMDACMQDATCTAGVINQGGGLPQSVISSLNKIFASSLWDTIIKVLGPTYAIAAPLCMIWQASIVNSGGVINANEGEMQRTGYQVASAADQQKYGEVNGAAIGAQARQMGNNSEVANSNVMKRASGIPVDTSASGVGPQQSAGGTYTYDVFSFLGPVDNVIRPIIKPVCAVFDNPVTGILIGILSIGIPAIRGAIEAVGESAAAGIGVFVRTLASNLGTSLLKMVSKKELAKMATVAGATIAGSLLAKYIALQHVGALNNGTSRGQDYDNQAEAGMIDNANYTERQQNLGAPMTASGTAQTKVQDLSYMSEQQGKQSVYQRYFAISNASSFISRLGVQAWAHMNLNTIPSLVLSAGRIFNPVSAFSGIFSFMSNRSLAASTATSDTTDYNIIQWGWTPIEEYHYESDPDYNMFNNQHQLDLSGQEQTIQSTYGICFTEKMGTLLAAGDIQRDASGNVITNAGLCAPDNLSPLNRDDPNQTDKMTFLNATAQLVFRYRVAMRDQNVTNQLVSTQSPSADTTSGSGTGTQSGGCGSGKYGALVNSNASFAGVDQGIDFIPAGSGSFNICAPAAGTITLADATGHIFQRTTGQAEIVETLSATPNAPSSSQYIYYAEIIKLAPGITVGATVQKGDLIGTSNASPGIEVGWGLNKTEGFMCPIGYPTACGTSFNNWVQAQ